MAAQKCLRLSIESQLTGALGSRQENPASARLQGLPSLATHVHSQQSPPSKPQAAVLTEMSHTPFAIKAIFPSQCSSWSWPALKKLLWLARLAPSRSTNESATKRHTLFEQIQFAPLARKSSRAKGALPIVPSARGGPVACTMGVGEAVGIAAQLSRSRLHEMGRVLQGVVRTGKARGSQGNGMVYV